MRLFDRRWKITVDTLEVTDLDVEFSIERSLYTRAGKAEVSIYNLAEDHRAQARRWRSREGAPPNDVVRRTRVRIEAGYRDGMSVLFQGNVRRVDNIRAQPEWVTKVTAGDGEESMRSARGARAFGPDTRIEEVIRYAADAMGVGVGNLSEAIAGAALERVGSILPGGAVVHGRVARELHRLLRSCGLEWSIQDGVLQVLPRGGALTRTAVLLKPETGLVDAPTIGLNRIVECSALIQPDLTPGAQVRLESAVVTGYYRVETVRYTGNTRSTEWHAALTLRRIRDDGSLVGIAPP